MPAVLVNLSQISPLPPGGEIIYVKAAFKSE